MFRYETSNKIIVTLFILLVRDIQIIASDLRFKDTTYKLKKQFKNQKHNVVKQNGFYPSNGDISKVNDYEIEQDLFENQMPYKFKYSNRDWKENYLRKINQIFGYEDPNYDYNYSDSSNQITRRETSPTVLQNTSLYPSVLTKALEISLNSSAPSSTGGNRFSDVAHKMNTTALDLAKILTKTENSNADDQFSKIIENYKRTKETPIPGTVAFKSTLSQNLQKVFDDTDQSVEQHIEGLTASNLAAIFDHVLSKLEDIQKMRNHENNDDEHPDGVPCDIIGSWSSATLGFCFDMQFLQDKNRYISPAEINNKVLSVNISECIPAKHHKIIDMEWKFTGSALRQWGGPFYLYGQKKSEGILSTFLGFCRICNGIDTIFGSWNILSPTKDCHDVSLGNGVRQDILRRVRMETKRKERFKNLLYQSRHGKL